MSICPGTDGKAWNSSLLAKGAADWSAAGAHLEGFPLKKVEEGLWKMTSLRGLNVGGVPISVLGSKSSFKNFLWGILATFWKPNYLLCFGDIGRAVRVPLGSLVHPKIGGKSTPAHPWAHKYTRVVLNSVPSGPKGMKMTCKVVPNVPKWC